MSAYMDINQQAEAMNCWGVIDTYDFSMIHVNILALCKQQMNMNMTNEWQNPLMHEVNVLISFCMVNHIQTDLSSSLM